MDREPNHWRPMGPWLTRGVWFFRRSQSPSRITARLSQEQTTCRRLTASPHALRGPSGRHSSNSKAFVEEHEETARTPHPNRPRGFLEPLNLGGFSNRPLDC